MTDLLNTTLWTPSYTSNLRSAFSLSLFGHQSSPTVSNVLDSIRDQVYKLMTVNEYQPFASTGFEAGLVSWLSEDKSRVNKSAEHQTSTMLSPLRGSTTTFTVGLQLDG